MEYDVNAFHREGQRLGFQNVTNYKVKRPSFQQLARCAGTFHDGHFPMPFDQAQGNV